MDVAYTALPELKKLCNEETLKSMIVAGMNRFKEQNRELGDGVYCCRMILSDLADEDKMVLFMLQAHDKTLPPILMMLWREAVDTGLLPLLQAMVTEGSYRKGPGAIAFPELLRKSGVFVE